LHRFLLEHHVDREVLADVAQKIDEMLFDEPFRVVEHQSRGLAGAELQNRAIWSRWRWRFSRICSLESSGRSLALPDGSPINPVPPPISTMADGHVVAAWTAT